MESQQKAHHDDAEQIALGFERLKLEKENSRGRQIQTLPKYDGINIEVDEWTDRVRAVLKGNSWDLSKLLEALPGSLSGQAKRGYDSLRDTDRDTIDNLLHNLRNKIDPEAKYRNKELFNYAKRGNKESNHTFADRLRMYIRRSGGDAGQHWAEEMIRSKITESMTPTDRKILRATVNEDGGLDAFIKKADELVTNEECLIGAVTAVGNQGFMSQWGHPGGGMGGQQMRGFNGGFDGLCWLCEQPGHRRRECPRRGEMQYMGNNGFPPVGRGMGNPVARGGMNTVQGGFQPPNPLPLPLGRGRGQPQNMRGAPNTGPIGGGANQTWGHPHGMLPRNPLQNITNLPPQNGGNTGYQNMQNGQNTTQPRQPTNGGNGNTIENITPQPLNL